MNKNNFKSTMALLVVFALLISMFQNTGISIASSKLENQFEGNGFVVDFVVDSLFENGYNATITIKNTGNQKIENWNLVFDLEDRIDNIWNASVSENTCSQYIIKNVGWNQDIAVDSSVSFGFSSNDSFSDFPEFYSIQSKQTVVKTEQYKMNYNITNAWDTGFNGTIEIINCSDDTIEDWGIEFDFPNTISNIWNADICSFDANHYKICCADYNQNIQPESSISFGFSCSDVANKVEPSNVVLTQYVVEKEDGKVPSTQNPEENVQPTQNPENEVTEVSTESAIDSIADNVTESAIDSVFIEFEQGNTFESVIDDVRFVNSAPDILEVKWKSSKEGVVSNSGQVTRGNQDIDVDITATIFYNGEKFEKNFNLNVIGIPMFDISTIKDLSTTQLQEMNNNDDDYDIDINDFGYVEMISGKFSDIKVKSYETALLSLYSIKSAMGITNPLEELQPYDVYVDEGGYVFKFVQIYKGIKTFSNVVTVTADLEGNTDYFSSTYYPISTEVNILPIITYDDAVGILKQKYGEIEVFESEEQYCILNYYGHADFVWEIVCALTEDVDGMKSGTYKFLISGSDREIKFHGGMANNITYRNGRTVAKAKDVLGNERKFYVTRRVRYSQVMNEPIGYTYSLEDLLKNITVYKRIVGVNKYQLNKIPSTIQENNWDKEETSVMANFSAVYDFYEKNFKRYSYNEAASKSYGAQIKANYNVYYEEGESAINNAFWDNAKKQFYIGKGNGVKEKIGYTIKDDVTMAAAKDIVCHEFTHAVVADETTLDNYNLSFSRAINEAYADMAACFFEENWEICESITENNIPMRDIKNPERVGCAKKYDSSDKNFADLKKKTKDVTGCYKNSTILSHAVYLMYEKYKISYKKLKKIWYQTLQMGYTNNSDFYDVRVQFIKSSKKYNYTKCTEKIIKAFDDVNVKKVSAQTSYQGHGIEVDQNYYCASYFDNDIILHGKVISIENETSDEKSECLSDVQVDAFSLADSQVLDSTKTDVDGCYEMNLEGHNEYVLRYQMNGFLNADMYLSGINTLAQKEYYSETVEMIPDSLDGIGDVKGKVKDAVSGKGVGSLKLKIRSGINNIYTNVILEAETDINGNYFLSDLKAGHYTIEIVNDEKNNYISTWFNVKVLGNQTLQNQDGVISAKLKEKQIRIVLTWGELPTNLDTYIRCHVESDYVVNYRQREFYCDHKVLCTLNTDDKTSYGPETVTINSEMAGNYTYVVQDFSWEKWLGESDACVKVYIGGANYPVYTFYPPADTKVSWVAFKYYSATGRLEVLNNIDGI